MTNIVNFADFKVAADNNRELEQLVVDGIQEDEMITAITTELVANLVQGLEDAGVNTDCLDMEIACIYEEIIDILDTHFSSPIMVDGPSNDN